VIPMRATGRSLANFLKVYPPGPDGRWRMSFEVIVKDRVGTGRDDRADASRLPGSGGRASEGEPRPAVSQKPELGSGEAATQSISPR
jgi:hypothetical protein